MTTSSKVVWSEGMFLHPHHFQQQDRYIEHLLYDQVRSIHPYYWGITELKIDEQLLALGKFAITSGKGVLADGTFFDIPTRDKAPPPLVLSPQAINSIIYIATPIRRAGNPEVALEINPAAAASRYQAETIEINDCNLGSETITPIQIGKLQLRLLLSNNDNQGFECLGLARIEEVRADHKVILDKQYLPPCLNIHAVPVLANFLREIQGLIHYRGNVLMQRLAAHEASGLSEAHDFMLLQIMNRFEPLMAHLTTLQSLHPERLFSLLIQLMGELATFTTQERRPMQMPQYLHHDLQSVFMPLIQELRRNLSIVIEETAIALKIEQQQPNTWTSTIHDKSALDQSTFILSVYTDLPPEDIRILFPAQAKAAPVEQLQQLVIRSLPGIELAPITPPRQIPYHANHSYFMLNKSSMMWQQLKNSAALAIHIGGDFPELALKLWRIKDKEL